VPLEHPEHRARVSYPSPPKLGLGSVEPAPGAILQTNQPSSVSVACRWVCWCQRKCGWAEGFPGFKGLLCVDWLKRFHGGQERPKMVTAANNSQRYQPAITCCKCNVTQTPAQR